jgi:hypothetical protein
VAEWGYVRDVSGHVIGAALGFGLAMWWDRRKESGTVRARRRTTSESLLLEIETLQSSIGILEDSFNPSATSPGAIAVEFTLPFLLTAAFDAAVHSGNLALLSPEVQSQVASVYEHVRIAKLHVDNIATSYAKDFEPEDVGAYLSNSYGYLRASCEMIRNGLPSLIGALKEA